MGLRNEVSHLTLLIAASDLSMQVPVVSAYGIEIGTETCVVVQRWMDGWLVFNVAKVN